MMLFASDDDVRSMQRSASKLPKGAILSAADQRRELMENERELREHRRWREFSYLLFVVPAIVGLVSSIAAWIAIRMAIGGMVSGLR